MNLLEYIVDVNEDTFDAEVLDHSRHVPVVVLFMKPRDLGCQTYAPKVERLANVSHGGFRLAKVNLDENPKLAKRFDIYLVPWLKAFRDGKETNDLIHLWGARVLDFIEQLFPQVKQKAEEDAKAGMRLLLSGLITSEAITILGIAHWDTIESTAGTVVGKLMGSALLGGLGWILAGARHRIGVLAVGETELFVLDFGTIYGEDASLNVLLSCTGQPSVKSAPLGALTATCREMDNSAIVSVRGSLKLDATFTNSDPSTSVSRATEITRAMNAAHAKGSLIH